MKRRRFVLFGLAVVVITFGVLAWIPSSKFVIGDGAFLQAEHRIRFLNANGEPIQNVDVVITDRLGKHAIGYPVSNYSGRGSLRSNGDGEIALCHVSKPVEFSFKKGYYCYFIPYEHGGIPEYTLTYYLDDKPIYHHAYFDLDSNFLQTHSNVDAFPIRERTVTVVGDDGRPVSFTGRFIENHKTITLSLP